MSGHCDQCQWPKTGLANVPGHLQNRRQHKQPGAMDAISIKLTVVTRYFAEMRWRSLSPAEASHCDLAVRERAVGPTRLVAGRPSGMV
jgi:hypothetical protein